MKTFLRIALASLLAIGPTTADALAQCAVPDGLDGGPCCTPTDVKLPKFPSFTQDILNICWKDCDVENVLPCRAEFTSPVSFGTANTGQLCGRFAIRLRLFGPNGQLKWRGGLKMQYSRTWLETKPNGDQLQVWRFLLNGNMRPRPAAGPMPCPVPPCAAAFGRVRATGYLDYARDCATGQFSQAWMLSHICDSVDHAPGFPRAGAFHPDRSYSFVGPAAGFVPSPLTPIASGGTTVEGVRRVNLPVPGAVGPWCEFEEQIQSSLQPIQQSCLCGPAAATPQWAISALSIGGACGTSVSTPGGPFLPGYISMGIGGWTDPAAYPGLEILRWNGGNYVYGDPCTGVQREEVFYGVTTLRGYEARQVLNTGAGPTLPLTFVDQSNSLRSGNTVMNIPYISDHFLHLNYP